MQNEHRRAVDELNNIVAAANLSTLPPPSSAEYSVRICKEYYNFKTEIAAAVKSAEYKSWLLV